MDLADALFTAADDGATDRRLVAFVGAGGKKTAVGRLLEAAAARGRSVVYTTTTHSPPVAGLDPRLVAPADLPDALATAPDSPTMLASEAVPNPDRVDRKVRGYDPETVDAGFAAGGVDWLLVKADGARKREFKAPADHEPAVPSRTTHVVPVASAKAIGRPLAAPTVHRPERIAAVAGQGIDVGDEITPGVVGRVLASDAGGVKGVPVDATVVPVVNKADTDAERASARRAIEVALDATSRFDRGLVTSFRRDHLTVVDGVDD
jgi:probable selenium-dependent hydroxylase accessory protein YqeC